MKRGFLKEAAIWALVIEVIFVGEIMLTRDFHPASGWVPIYAGSALAAVIGGVIVAFWFRFLRSWRKRTPGGGNSKLGHYQRVEVAP